MDFLTLNPGYFSVLRLDAPTFIGMFGGSTAVHLAPFLATTTQMVLKSSLMSSHKDHSSI